MKIKYTMQLLVYRVPLVLGILALLLSFAGGKVAAASPAFIRVIHASPDVGTADVFVDGKVFLSSFQFGAVTDYAPVPPGPHKVQIALVGKGIGASVITETLAVTPGLAYTVAAVGTKTAGLSLEAFIDNNVVSGNAAKVRVYQLSPDAGSISVSKGSAMLLNNLPYKQASSYLTVPAASTALSFSGGSLSSPLPWSESLKANTVTSIFSVGLVKGTPAIQIVSTSASGTPSMPGTGSDPNATQSQGSQGVSPWVWGMLIIVMVGLGTLSVGRDVTQRIRGLRSHHS
jgi:Domain of unknown function (DUF4397)